MCIKFCIKHSLSTPFMPPKRVKKLSISIDSGLHGDTICFLHKIQHWCIHHDGGLQAS